MADTKWWKEQLEKTENILKQLNQLTPTTIDERLLFATSVLICLENIDFILKTIVEKENNESFSKFNISI